MNYYCGTCLKNIKKKSKYSRLKSKSQKGFEKYKHIVLSLRNNDIKDVDELLYLYIKDRKETFNHYLLNGEFKPLFNNIQDFKNILTGVIDNRTFFSWSNYLRDAINNLKEERYHFNYIAEMNNIKLAHKRERTYDFYSRHNMSAIEWKQNAMINKDKSLLNKFPRIWRHPLNR